MAEQPKSWKKSGQEDADKKAHVDIGRGLLIAYLEGDKKPVQFLDVTDFQELDSGLLTFEFFEAPRQARMTALLKVAEWVYLTKPKSDEPVQ